MGKVKTKIKLPPPQPRSLEELNRLHNELCARAGAYQYQVSVYQEEIAKLNQSLRQVNEEAAERRKLDASKPESSEEATSA